MVSCLHLLCSSSGSAADVYASTVGDTQVESPIGSNGTAHEFKPRTENGICTATLILSWNLD